MAVRWAWNEVDERRDPGAGRDRADSRLPVPVLLAAVQLPVRANVLAVHRAGDREVRPVPRRLDGRQANRAVPSGPPRWLRPRSMSFLPRRPILRLALALGFLVALAFVIAACSPIAPSTVPSTLAPGATAGPTTTAAPAVTPAPTALVIRPAEIKADPVSILAWLFNPIFQLFLIMLVGIHGVVGDMGIAIIITTLIVRTALVPLMRRQMVSMRRMQAIAPEVKELQRRFKGDRAKTQQATMALYKERGVSQAGCLVAMLPILLILPMYQVVREGLQAADLVESLKVFGFQVVPLTCPTPALVTLADGSAALRALHRLHDHVAGWHPRQRLRGAHPLAVRAAPDRRRDLRLRPLLHGAAARGLPDGAAAAQPRRAARSAGQDPALAVALAAADHRPVRQRDPRRRVPVPDRVDGLPDRPAVPDHRLGRDVPALRPDPGIRRGPFPALPGRRALGARIHLAHGGSAGAAQS